MWVAVGSEKEVKRTATERAFEGIPGTIIESVDVPSGVSDQPRGHQETILGAENRAQAARARIGAELGVGIEGGVAAFDGTEGLYLIMWAVVTDGETTGCAGGPSIHLPDAVAKRVNEGDELGPILDEMLGTDGIGRTRGAAGVLTGGSVERADALTTAVACALGPFVTDLY